KLGFLAIFWAFVQALMISKCVFGLVKQSEFGGGPESFGTTFPSGSTVTPASVGGGGVLESCCVLPLSLGLLLELSHAAASVTAADAHRRRTKGTMERLITAPRNSRGCTCRSRRSRRSCRPCSRRGCRS